MRVNRNEMQQSIHIYIYSFPQCLSIYRLIEMRSQALTYHRFLIEILSLIFVSENDQRMLKMILKIDV